MRYPTSGPLESSDHHSVLTTIKLSSKTRPRRPPTRKIWLYSRADLPLARSLLSDLSLRPPQAPTLTLACWSQWNTRFLSAMEKSVPSRYIPIKSFTLWIDCNIRNDMHRRERLYRKFKRSNWLLKYRSLRNKITAKIRLAKKLLLNP